MKKILFSLTLLACLSHSESLTTTDQGLYAGVGLGIFATDDKGNSGIGLSLKAGVSLEDTLKGLGLQLELNKSLSDPENASHKDIDVLTMAAYTTFDITIPNSKVSLRPRIGVILPNMKDDIDSRDVILSSGFGMTYALEDNMRLYADYTVLGEDISNYSAGLEIKF